MIDELSVACLHMATPEERDRDRSYQACDAKLGQPCHWAKRYDGVDDPEFHSERIESASELVVNGAEPVSKEEFDRMALATGLF